MTRCFLSIGGLNSIDGLVVKYCCEDSVMDEAGLCPLAEKDVCLCDPLRLEAYQVKYVEVIWKLSYSVWHS